MRIVAGKLGGRNFDSPRGNHTHPMSEKVRGALFAMLGDISGLTVLDAYAGSGALSLEAISRGALHATAVDNDLQAFKAIQVNAFALGVEDQVLARRKNVKGWSSNNQDLKFDIVLADPPYNDIWPDVLVKLRRHVKPRGLMVISWPGGEPPLKIEGFDVLTHKTYGDAQLIAYAPIGTA